MMRVLDPGDADVQALERRVLTAQARAEQDAGDIESALITLGRLCALDPDDAEARRNLDALHVQDAARTERSREIQQLYADGLDAFAVDDYDAARSRFLRALELAPEDADVRAMLVRVDRAVAQRLTVRVDEVRSLSRAGLVEEALAARDAVRLLGADAVVLDELDRAIDEARGRRDSDRRRREDERQRQAVLASLSSDAGPEPAPATPVPETTVVSAARRAELDALAQRARDVYAEGKVAEAVRLWELIWSEDPQDDETRDALRQEYLSHGMEHFSAGRLVEAVDSWENALRIDPDDRRTRSYLDRGRQQLLRIRRLQEDNGR
jgi:tetratricopeptide (TPR) repeat protein